MRWWRAAVEDPVDPDEAEAVRERLIRVVGPADGVFGLVPDSLVPEPVPVPAVAPLVSASASAPAPVAGAPWPAALSPRVVGPVSSPVLSEPAEPVDPVAARRALAAFDPGRRGLRVLAVVALVVAVGVGAAVWWSRPRAAAVPVAVTAGVVDAGETASGSVIVVAVTGRVQRPGLVRLPAGARVADAIDAAGGVLPGTDLTAVNLARKLADGEQVVVGASAAPATAGSGAAPGRLNLNTATLAELDALPGVGPVLAQRIIDYRTRTGGFRSVADLRKVDGVGDARYAELKDLVTV